MKAIANAALREIDQMLNDARDIHPARYRRYRLQLELADEALARLAQHEAALVNGQCRAILDEQGELVPPFGAVGYETRDVALLKFAEWASGTPVVGVLDEAGFEGAPALLDGVPVALETSALIAPDPLPTSAPVAPPPPPPPPPPPAPPAPAVPPAVKPQSQQKGRR